jgi:hypothetical protein
MASFTIGANEDFFARIVALIPQELYRHTDESSAAVGNTKYFKHRKVALTADEKKSISLIKKREKYTVENVRENDPVVAEAQTNVNEDILLPGPKEDLRSKLQVGGGVHLIIALGVP